MHTRVILWAAILSSVLVMGVIARFTAPSHPGALDSMMPIVMGIGALSNTVLSLFIPSLVARSAVADLKLPTAAAPSFGELPAGTKVFVDSDAARVAAIGPTMPAFIIRLALREAVAVFGFVLATMGFPFAVYANFFVFGFLLVALAYPRIAEVEVALESAYDAKLSHSR